MWACAVSDYEQVGKARSFTEPALCVRMRMLTTHVFDIAGMYIWSTN